MRTTFKLTQQLNRCGQSQSSEAWYWPSFHCKWSDVSVTVHCSSLILRSPCCFELSRASFSFPTGMFSEVDVGFAISFHTLCSRHIDPPELLHLADSSPMHGRNVALVAAMNSTTTSSCVVSGELDYLPPSVKCHITSPHHYDRLRNLPDSMPVKGANDEALHLHEQGFKSWVSDVWEIPNKYELSIETKNIVIPAYWKKTYYWKFNELLENIYSGYCHELNFVDLQFIQTSY